MDPVVEGPILHLRRTRPSSPLAGQQNMVINDYFWGPLRGSQPGTDELV